MTLDHKRTVDGHAEPPGIGGMWLQNPLVADRSQGLAQFRKAHPGGGGSMDDGCVVEKGALNQIADFHFHHFTGGGVHHIALGERYYAVPQT